MLQNNSWFFFVPNMICNQILEKIRFIKRLAFEIRVGIWRLKFALASGVRNSCWQSATAKAFAEAYLRFLLSASAKKKC